jgi:hypothetical protein
VGSVGRINPVPRRVNGTAHQKTVHLIKHTGIVGSDIIESVGLWNTAELVAQKFVHRPFSVGKAQSANTVAEKGNRFL